MFRQAQGRYESIPDEFRYSGDGIEGALESFRSALNVRQNNSCIREVHDPFFLSLIPRP